MGTLATLLTLPIAFSAAAQPTDDREVHTLFGDLSDRVTGAYASLSAKTFHALGQDAFLLGGRLAMIVDHKVSFGLAGFGLCNPLTNRSYNDYRAARELSVPDGLGLRMGYGGLFIEPVFFDASVVHLSVPITFGAGGASYGYQSGDSFYPRVIRTDGQAFFFVEPAVELEVNVIPAVRFGVGAAYFHTSALDLPTTGSDALRRTVLQFTIKAGQF